MLGNSCIGACEIQVILKHPIMYLIFVVLKVPYILNLNIYADIIILT